MGKWIIGGAVLLAVGAFVVALFGGFPENPGSESNRTHITVMQDAFDEHVATLSSEEAEKTRAWLLGVNEMYSRCSRGPVDESKDNRHEHFVKLASGDRLEDRTQLCMYDVGDPLPTRVIFKNGEVVDVQTSGREREWETKRLQSHARGFVHTVMRITR